MNIATKIKLIKYIGLGLLVILLIGLIASNKSLRSNNKRLEQNQQTLMSQTKKYKLNDSLSTAKVNVLNMKLSEIKTNNQVTSDIKISGTNKKDVDNYSSTETEQNYNVKPQQVQNKYIHDTLTQYIDTCKSFIYKSKWFDASGLICSKLESSISVTTRDSLVAIKATEPKKFIGLRLPKWLFGTKLSSFQIYSKNPHETILNVQYIEIKK
jgi:hypothetical protein